jgi:hypothetical protein
MNRRGFLARLTAVAAAPLAVFRRKPKPYAWLDKPTWPLVTGFARADGWDTTVWLAKEPNGILRIIAEDRRPTPR